MQTPATVIAAPVDVRLITGPVMYEPMKLLPPGAGGECVFFGRTRMEEQPEHGSLRRLSYEAYEPMAARVLEQIAREAIERFGCLAMRVHHAVGDVPIGEASVFVQVACGHRAEAFEACRFVIDELKSRAPIWKHEQWQDGATWAPGHQAGP
jgi:molybdopterin synthase catalytic subunit